MKAHSILLLAALVSFQLACSQSAPEKPSEPSTEKAPAPAAAEEVAYEPAFPEEVSQEDLSEEDTAQQEAGHSHGDGEHSHEGGEDHSHGDGEDHGGSH